MSVTGLCGCGCGREVALSRNRTPNKFVPGHRQKQANHLSLQEPLRIEERPQTNHKYTYKIYVFKCAAEDCQREIRYANVVKYEASTKKCASCSRRGPPYQHAFNRLVRSAKQRDVPVTLTYTEFLLLTKTDVCCYCGVGIPWQPYFPTKATEHQAYFLDRKNNKVGYTADNCVVCCPDCNWIKRGWATFEEFLLLAPGLRNVRLLRAETVWSPQHRLAPRGDDS